MSQPVETQDIQHLFEPRGVAIIGASATPGKIGYTLVSNLVQGGYQGRVHPINPRHSEIMGLPVSRSASALTGPVDLACIAVPRPAVMNAVRDCAAGGIRYLVLITAGFSEVGNEREEREITEYARSHGMRLLGPNIFGIYCARSQLNATFGPSRIEPGSVAIVTQSGAIGVAMIGKTADERLGLSAIVSVGNKADVDEADLLGYLARDESTRVILIYIEGVKDGTRLAEVLREVTRVKPVVVIKSGRSRRGAAAVASHTGSLAGSDQVFDRVMHQCGVLRADHLQEAFDWCKFLASAPRPSGEGGVIVTNGGGVGVLTTDACEHHDVRLIDDAPTLAETFGKIVPDIGSLKNPIDLTGQATEDDFGAALDAAIANEQMRFVIASYCETASTRSEPLARVMAQRYHAHGHRKPIVYSLFGGAGARACAERLHALGVPVYDETYEAVSCMGALYEDHRLRQREDNEREERLVATDVVAEAIRAARSENRTLLLPAEAQRVLDAAGIPHPRSAVARDLEQALAAAERIGYPVGLKIVSPDIAHKSDAGGVTLGLDNREELIAGYQAILGSCRRHDRYARLQGVEVVEMARPGVEVIVGARRDDSFGPILMFGLGGVYVEVMKDVTFRKLPICRREAEEMISEIRSYPLLLGVRGQKRKAIHAAIDTLVKVGSLIQGARGIEDIEINPLVVYDQGEGCLAIDARILIAGTEGTVR